MKRVVWTEDAEAQLLRLPLEDAETALTAIETLAERSIGFVRVMNPSGELRLYAGDCIMTFVESDDVIRVQAIRKR